MSQWNNNSELVVEYFGIGNQELGIDTKIYQIDDLIAQNKATTTANGLSINLDIPRTSRFQPQYIGSYKEGTRDPNKERQMQQARDIAQANPNRKIDRLRAVVKYALNPSMNPHYQLRSSVTSQ